MQLILKTRLQNNGVTCIRANTSPSREVPFINMQASVFLRILIKRIYFVSYQQETYIVM